MDLQILLARAPQRELAGIGDGHREAVLLERAAERIGPAVGADQQHAQFLALVDAQPPRPPRGRKTVREDRHDDDREPQGLQVARADEAETAEPQRKPSGDGTRNDPALPPPPAEPPPLPTPLPTAQK